jgi:hypothetical protein
MLSGKQEVTMARRVGNHYGHIAPIGAHYVPQSEDTNNSKQQIDLVSVTKEVPFLITAGELQERKNQRRKKHNAKGT